MNVKLVRNKNEKLMFFYKKNMPNEQENYNQGLVAHRLKVDDL